MDALGFRSFSTCFQVSLASSACGRLVVSLYFGSFNIVQIDTSWLSWLSSLILVCFRLFLILFLVDVFVCLWLLYFVLG